MLLVNSRLLADPVTATTAASINVHHTVPELQSLTVSDFQSDMNSQQGELQLRMTALEKIKHDLAQPASAGVDEQQVAAFSAAVLFNLDKKLARNQLRHALRNVDGQSPDVQREILTAVYTRYAKEMAPLLWTKLRCFNTEREFAIAGFALMETHLRKSARHRLETAMHRHFPEWQIDSRLIELDHALHVDARRELQERPALADLLAAPIRPGFPVVYSFQRKNRNVIGLVMVRGADGKFVRNSDGSYFNVPQLARAGNNLPSSITNGNTPQGIFTINGTGTSVDTIWIGPTPYLNSFMPVESSLSDFEHHEDSGTWSEGRYEDFLPASWRNYFPIKEAWRAGLAGRNEILAHGTTVNSDYYRNESFYPGTPSAGCLVAMEYWSKADGRMIHSDQLSLVKAFVSGGSDQGYMVVVNIDDLPRPVILSDVIDSINLAESSRQSQH